MEYPQIFSFQYVKDLFRHPEHLRLPVKPAMTSGAATAARGGREVAKPPRGEEMPGRSRA